MQGQYKIQNLGCAKCAQKMEDQINKLENVDKAQVNFISQRLRVQYRGDEDLLLEQMQKIVSKIERKAKIVG